MSAFTTALADEVSLARTALFRARERHDDAAATEALERLRDLAEIDQRVRDGLHLVARRAHDPADAVSAPASSRAAPRADRPAPRAGR